MHILSTSPTDKHLRRKAGALRQRTFRTPLDRLPAFAGALLESVPRFESGSLILEQIVFTPKHLHDLFSRHRLSSGVAEGLTITAVGRDEAQELLVAALGDWVDFYFMAVPGSLFLYAAHDEYTTAFSARTGPLSRLAASLSSAGVQEIEGCRREL